MIRLREIQIGGAELYQVSVKTINEHLKNIYDEGELDPEATIRKFRIVQTEGNREVSRELAEAHAHAEFLQYDNERRRLEAAQPSDFDKAVEGVKKLERTKSPEKKRAKKEGGEG